MTTSTKGLFVASVLFGVVGIALTYDAIVRMRQAALPPFHVGLYTAAWAFPPPPGEVILACDTLPGRIVVLGSALVVPALSGYLLVRRGWLVVAFLLLGLWSFCSGGFGIWMWIFSLLYGRTPNS